MGIGASTAIKLARRGVEVTIAARSQEKLNHVASMAPGIKCEVADLQDPRARQKLFGSVGPVDILINNAGFGLTKDFAYTSPQQVGDLFELNVVALIDLTQKFLPSMIESKRGHICNIGSSISHLPAPPLTVYAATKGAVAAFSDALRREVFASGVSVSLIQPGPVQTGFWDRAAKGNVSDVDEDSGFGIPVDWVSSAIVRSIRYDKVPGYATVAVPRPLGAGRVLDVPGVSLAVDALVGLGTRFRGNAF